MYQPTNNNYHWTMDNVVVSDDNCRIYIIWDNGCFRDPFLSIFTLNVSAEAGCCSEEAEKCLTLRCGEMCLVVPTLPSLSH